MTYVAEVLEVLNQTRYNILGHPAWSWGLSVIPLSFEVEIFSFPCAYVRILSVNEFEN